MNQPKMNTAKIFRELLETLSRDLTSRFSGVPRDITTVIGPYLRPIEMGEVTERILATFDDVTKVCPGSNSTVVVISREHFMTRKMTATRLDAMTGKILETVSGGETEVWNDQRERFESANWGTNDEMCYGPDGRVYVHNRSRKLQIHQYSSETNSYVCRHLLDYPGNDYPGSGLFGVRLHLGTNYLFVTVVLDGPVMFYRYRLADLHEGKASYELLGSMECISEVRGYVVDPALDQLYVVKVGEDDPVYLQGIGHEATVVLSIKNYHHCIVLPSGRLIDAIIETYTTGPDGSHCVYAINCYE